MGNEIISEAALKRFIEFINKRRKEVYDEPHLVYHDQITKEVLADLENYYSGKKVLDIGCGTGLAASILSEKADEYWGISLSENEVNKLKSLGLNAEVMDQSFLKFEDGSFDFIWSRHVLEHSFMPMYTLSEYRRVLDDDGIIYIEIPSENTPFRHESNPNHYSVFTHTLWLNLFEKVGLKIVNAKKWKIDFNEAEDFYYSYTLKKAEKREKEKKKLLLALSKGENFGWGVCSKYLKKEVPKLVDSLILENEGDFDTGKTYDFKVFHALTGLEFESITKIRGKENYGYTFFENELIELSKQNAKKYDIVFGGSEWCTNKMKEFGIENSETLLQGIDPEIFYPIEDSEVNKNDNLFVIFSGGKFEYRKAQDIVLKAFKILHEKYDDIVLMNAWYNMWPQTMGLMANSKHIKFEVKGNTWTEIMNNIYAINGIDPQRVITHEIVDNFKLRELYKLTDVALFPNRCEGGTNLVMMEYMACGKPVIAFDYSGHKDILTDENSIKLNSMVDARLYNNGALWADWWEPELDEVLEALEFAYHNREQIKSIGKRAGEDLKKFTWEQTAKDLIRKIY